MKRVKEKLKEGSGQSLPRIGGSIQWVRKMMAQEISLNDEQ